MRYLTNLFVCLLCFAGMAVAQPKPAYQIFTADGKPADYGTMLQFMQLQEVVLFGEYHNNPIAHWLQLELTRDLGDRHSLILGAEMFEADNQAPLNQFLAGQLSAKGLDSAARLWKNYTTDYAPLVQYAKEKNWPFVATNVPRKFASMVAKQGFEVLDTLSLQQKQWMAPLPIAYDSLLPCYKNMLVAMGGHGGPNLPKAQALKDATMAHFILANLKPNTIFIHYNGAYHSDNFESINWYLKKAKPAIRIGTISTVSQKNLDTLEKEHLQKAHFVIVVDEDMTTTY
jgi:uncharacterized iron-regulated protein